MADIIKNDCQGEGEAADRETFSDPTDIIPMTDQYDWRCFVNPKHGTWFLCKDGFPLRDSSKFNTIGWRVCAVEIGREEAIRKFAAEISRLQAENEEAREIIGFYADKDNWRARRHPQIDTDTVPVTRDGGSRARAFLTKGETDA